MHICMKKFTGSLHIGALFAVLILAMFSGIQNSYAQSTVQVTVTGIPPILPSPFISDFERNVFNGNYMVSANVTGGSSLDVRFRVRVMLAGEILVDEISEPRELQPGFNNLTPFPQEVFFEATTGDVLNNLPSNRIRQAYQTGSFPEGNYTLTIEPLLAGNNTPLGAPGFSTFTVLYPQPPILIAPFNNTVLAESMSVPVFSWSPVMGPPGSSFEYEFLMVELFDGQNPGDALLSNREHSQVVRSNNLFPYTADNLPLELGKSYAWQVTARDVNGEIPLKNDGKSDIHVFTFGTVPDDDDSISGVFPPGDPLPDTDPITENIPVTRITGNVSWKYSATEGHLSSMPVIPSNIASLGSISNASLAASLNDPNYQPDTASLQGQTLHTGTANFRQSAALTTTGGIQATNASVPVFGGGRTNAVQIANIEQEPAQITSQISSILNDMPSLPYENARVRAVYTSRDGTRHILATGRTNEDGNFILTFAPSELAQLLQTSGQPATTQLLGGRVQAPSNEDILNAFQNRPFQTTQFAHTEVEIEVISPYADFPDDKTIAVSTSSARNYDVGTVAGTALTYRLSATVLDSETNFEIDNATIEVFRQARFYNQHPALRSEGFPSPDDSAEEERFNGSRLLRAASAQSSTAITRLFAQESGFNDRYYVRISAPGYSSRIIPFSARPSILPGEIVIIEQTFEINRANPVVEGRLIRRDTQSPVTNTPVALIAPGSGSEVLATVTDNEGRFSISDIEPNDEPYVLEIRSSRFATYTEELTLDQTGIKITRDPILLDASMVTVVGRIVSDNDTPVANATVRWAEGGTPVQSDTHGRFVTANTAGTHQLQIRKIGHTDIDTTITITLDDDDLMETVNWSGAAGSIAANSVGQWANSINSSPSFTQTQQIAGTFNPGSLAYTGNTEQNFGVSNSISQTVINNQNLNVSQGQFDSMTAYFNNVLGEDASVSEEVEDIGDIFMSRAVGRLEISVVADDSGDPLANALVEVGEAGLMGETDSDGVIFFDESPAGTVPVRISASQGMMYVPIATEVSVTDDGRVTSVTIALEAGAAAEGVVTIQGAPLEGATIRLEGREDISTISEADGTYVLAGVPDGEWTVRVSKSGYVGVSETRNFGVGETEEIDFELDESAFEITTLLGFEIEVDELSISSDTTISGAFVAIQSNALMAFNENLRIPFSNVNVYEHNGELLPVGGYVTTDITELNAKVFDFLFVKIKNSGGLEVRQRLIPSSVGFIAGEVEINYASSFTSVSGWRWPSEIEQFLRIPNVEDLPDGISDHQLVAVTSDGSFPFPEVSVADFELNLFSAGNTFNIYGFPLNAELTESKLKNDGLYLSGAIAIQNVPFLDAVGLQLEELWIGTDGSIRNASLQLNPNPSIQLAGWSFEISAGYMSETGFNFGGTVNMNIPQTAQATVTFSDLMISEDRVFGGAFQLPASGIMLFDIVNIGTMPGNPITLGKVQDEDVYYLSGGVFMQMPGYITQAIGVPDFIVRSDGDFSVTVAPNLDVSFAGLARLKVNSVRFSNIDEPVVEVGGQFMLTGIPFVSAQAGGLTYRRGGGVSVDQISLGFNMGAIGQVAVGIEFVDEPDRQGFEGSGMIDITNTPISAAINFSYLREGDGTIISANVQAGVPPIVVGSLTISSLGGGFVINRANDSFEVTISGVVSAAPGTESAVALNPLQVSVRSGPVITGYTALSIMNQQIADADLTIDFPNRLFDIEARLNMNQLGDVQINANGAARIVLSGGDDPYWMIGVRFQAQMLQLFTANANILASWDLDVNANPQYNDYTSFIRDEYIHGGKVTGFHLDVAASYGIRPQNQVCVTFLKAIRGCGYFYNETRCQLNFDPVGNTFGFHLGSNWSGGGEVSVTGLGGIGGANVTATGSVSGNYANGIWTANGTASGSVSGYVGDCNVGCSTEICTRAKIIPVGASLCAGASIAVDYRSNQGMSVSLDLGDD